MAASSRFNSSPIITAVLILQTMTACLSVGDPFESLSEGYTSVARSPDEPSDVGELPETAQKDIQSALDRGWMGIYRDGTFRPHAPVTREGFASILHRALLSNASPPPSAPNKEQLSVRVAEDVGADRWSRVAVESLAAWKVIRPDQNFFPEIAITREEASMWILSVLQTIANKKSAHHDQGLRTLNGSKPGRLYLDADEQLRPLLAALTSACPALELALKHPALFVGNNALSRQQAAIWAHSAWNCADSKKRPESKSGQTADYETTCDVVINGGTLAGLSAALTAAQAGKITCLIEPFSYPAGYWLSAAEPVPLPALTRRTKPSALVKLEQKTPFAEVARLLTDAAQPGASPRAFEPAYLRWLRSAGAVECANQHLCFNPSAVLEHGLAAQLGSQPTLFIFGQSRVSGIDFSGSAISGLLLRQQRSEADRSNTHPDATITILVTGNIKGNHPQKNRDKESEVRSLEEEPHSLVVIEASPLGDVLVQAGTNWLQGMESAEAIEPGADQCGSAFGFPAFAKIPSTVLRSARAESANANGRSNALVQGKPSRHRLGIFNGKEWSPQDIRSALTTWPLWEEEPESSKADRSPSAKAAYFYQEKGNIYAREGFLASREETLAQNRSPSGWRGGLNERAINHARETLKGWMRFLSATTGETVKPLRGYFPLNAPIAPFPRISTGRRGIGWKGFLINKQFATEDVMAWVRPRKRFFGLQTCAYPKIIRSVDEAPPMVPIALRSLITEKSPNLILSGPAIASDFYFNHLLSSADAHWKSGLLAGSLAVTLLDLNGSAISIESNAASFASQSTRLWKTLLTPVNR